MDLVLMFTIIGTGVAVAGLIIGAMFTVSSWFLGNMKTFEANLQSDMRSYKTEIRSWKDEINKEMKDFHGRLCSLEGRTKTGP